MSDKTYDLPIGEVAKVLDKSDRQVRRYVKEKRLSAKPMRIDGHIKLLFSRDEVLAFRDGGATEVSSPEIDEEMVIDAQLVGDGDGMDVQSIDATVMGAGSGDGGAVKYAIDALKEQIAELRQENRELQSQLQNVSGLVGFWQGKAEVLQDEVKMLNPAPKAKRSLWAWFWGKA